MENIEVSVICNTFNHGKYIREALEGFIMQKTNFPFEVLVHDDASTDNTAEIIREYEEKYPDIIKPVYQTENQYSKGVAVTVAFGLSRAKGKYLALCEGDDFWTDPLKLQKQFDALENHPEIDMCVHAAYKIDADSGEKCGRMAPKKMEKEKLFSVEEVILEGGNGQVATSAIFYRKSMMDKVPEYRRKHSFDYTLQINGAMRGGLLYLGEFMSAYRTSVSGSWTQRVWGNREKRLQHLDRTLDMLKILNEETEFKYNDAIQTRTLLTEISKLTVDSNYKAMLSKRYKPVFKNFPIKRKIKIIVGACFPLLLKLKK